jgi:uncharacterized protein YbaP (TraB family)
MRRLFKTISFFIVAMLAWPGMCLAGDDSALYWAISRDGQSVGFLLGTIHSEDPRVLDFPDSFISELSGNQVFAMEMVPDLPTLKRLTEYMHYQDGTTLESIIGTERFNSLLAALKSYRVPEEWIRKMKVWAAMMTLSVPPPESGFFMDFSLSLRAAGAGLKVVGLETLEEQLSFLEEMPMEQQLQLLDEALESYDKVGEIHDQMVEDYLSGDVQALRRQAEQQLDLLEPGTKQYFMEQGIDSRNSRMLESLLLQLGDKRVFVAVGALHLPGENGMVELLRQRGFNLTPLPLPLLPPE